jgi:hypothetical protein
MKPPATPHPSPMYATACATRWSGSGRLTKQRALVTEGAENCDKAVTFMREQKLVEVLPIAEANLADARKALAEVGGVE